MIVAGPSHAENLKAEVIVLDCYENCLLEARWLGCADQDVEGIYGGDFSVELAGEGAILVVVFVNALDNGIADHIEEVQVVEGSHIGGRLLASFRWARQFEVSDGSSSTG